MWARRGKVRLTDLQMDDFFALSLKLLGTGQNLEGAFRSRDATCVPPNEG